MNDTSKTVHTEQELYEALVAAGLTPTPLPELPVTVNGITYQWAEPKNDD